MIYVLTKGSTPSWEFNTEHKNVLLGMLENCVCNICTRTKEDMIQEQKEDPQEWEYTEEDYSLAFPDNYNQMSYEDKVAELLWTPCGAEYLYNEYPTLKEYYESSLNLLYKPF